jgi:hypothetical protein
LQGLVVAELLKAMVLEQVLVALVVFWHIHHKALPFKITQ